ncbi:MAG: hypothetical protein WCY93_12290 [Anaerolineaceae bacterium]
MKWFLLITILSVHDGSGYEAGKAIESKVVGSFETVQECSQVGATMMMQIDSPQMGLMGFASCRHLPASFDNVFDPARNPNL